MRHLRKRNSLELAVGEGPEEIGEGVVGNWEAWRELEGWEVEVGEKSKRK